MPPPRLHNQEEDDDIILIYLNLKLHKIKNMHNLRETFE